MKIRVTSVLMPIAGILMIGAIVAVSILAINRARKVEGDKSMYSFLRDEWGDAVNNCLLKKVDDARYCSDLRKQLESSIDESKSEIERVEAATWLAYLIRDAEYGAALSGIDYVLLGNLSDQSRYDLLNVRGAITKEAGDYVEYVDCLREMLKLPENMALWSGDWSMMRTQIMDELEFIESELDV